MTYFEDVLAYLRESHDRDQTIDQASSTLDKIINAENHSWHENYSSLEHLLPEEIKTWQPVVAMLSHPNDHNPYFLSMASAQAETSVNKAIREIDLDTVRKKVLECAGYDLPGLSKAKKVIVPELERWKKDNNYPVPIREFFDEKIAKPWLDDVPVAQDIGMAEIKRFASEIYNLTSPRIRQVGSAINKVISTGILIPILAAAVPAFLTYKGLQFMAAGKKAMGKMTDGSTMDFNQFNEGSAVEVHEELYYKVPIDADFLIATIVTGMNSKHSTLKELQNSGYTTQVLGGLSELINKEEYTIQTAPSAQDGTPPRILNQEITQEGWTSITYSPKEWDAYKLVAQKLPIDLETTAEYRILVDTLRAKNASPATIAESVGSLFQYGQPAKSDEARFEAALKQRRGVCQDVNFWVMHALREVNYTESYLAIGYVRKNSTITTDDCHAQVIMNHEGTLQYVDGTPGSNFTERLAQTGRNWHVAKKPQTPSFSRGGSRDTQRHSLDESVSEEEVNSLSQQWDNFKAQASRTVNNAKEFSITQYKTAKKAIRQLLVKGQAAFYSDYVDALSNTTREAVSVSNTHSIASSMRLVNHYCQNIKGIKVQTTGDVGRVEVVDFIKPEQIKHAVGELEYITAATPQRAQRFNQDGHYRAVLDELSKSGKLFPFSANDPNWRDGMEFLLKLANRNATPPELYAVSTPERVIFTLNTKYAKELSVVLPPKIEYVGYGESDIPELIANTPELQSGKYSFSVTNKEQPIGASRYIDSPEVKSFDSGRSGNNLYWQEIKSTIQDISLGRELHGYSMAISQVLKIANRRLAPRS